MFPFWVRRMNLSSPSPPSPLPPFPSSSSSFPLPPPSHPPSSPSPPPHFSLVFTSFGSPLAPLGRSLAAELAGWLWLAGYRQRLQQFKAGRMAGMGRHGWLAWGLEKASGKMGQVQNQGASKGGELRAWEQGSDWQRLGSVWGSRQQMVGEVGKTCKGLAWGGEKGGVELGRRVVGWANKGEQGSEWGTTARLSSAVGSWAAGPWPGLPGPAPTAGRRGRGPAPCQWPWSSCGHHRWSPKPWRSCHTSGQLLPPACCQWPGWPGRLGHP